MVADAVQQGIVHLNTEVIVNAVAALRENSYAAFPLLALPSCKADTAERQREMVNSILTEWKEKFTNCFTRTTGFSCYRW